MNYTLHLNHWFKLLERNPQVNPTHISLYLALFQFWHEHHFPESFFINRTEIMKWSKINSKSTFSHCMHDLHQWGWITYTPSNSIYSKSLVKPSNFTHSKHFYTPPLKTAVSLLETPPHNSLSKLLTTTNTSTTSNYHEPL